MSPPAFLIDVGQTVHTATTLSQFERLGRAVAQTTHNIAGAERRDGITIATSRSTFTAEARNINQLRGQRNSLLQQIDRLEPSAYRKPAARISGAAATVAAVGAVAGLFINR